MLAVEGVIQRKWSVVRLDFGVDRRDHGFGIGAGEDCIAFSVDSTLLAAMNFARALEFSAGFSRNDFLAASVLKQ